MKSQTLFTRDTSIPIIYAPPIRVSYELPGRSELRVKLPVNLLDGDGILEHVQFNEGVRMPAAIVKCKKGFTTTVIQNYRTEPMTLTINSPFKVEPFQENECHLNFTNDDSSIDSLLTKNLSKLRLEHMNEEEKEMIGNICREYKDIFYCEDIPLSFTNQVKHEIRTTNEDPIFNRAHRLPPSQTAEIKSQVEKMLRDNVIQESHSPWSAPVHLVPKKVDASGKQKWRMVVDYRRLNEITVDDKYPLPNISDLFDMLGKSMYFTTLDLASGYHQLEVREEDRPKTAFSTPFGHYEFNRMPFGLKTAPATFQRAMDNVLRGLQGIHCLIYLDDVIIFSKSLPEHIQKLRAVFDRFRQTNLKVQLDKSHFLRKEVLYLGHTITREGLKPNTDKIDAILNYPIPKTTTEIKSFLGLIGYYRKFIKDFAKITRPLTVCLKKGRKIVLNDEYTNSFETCKKLLTNAPLLQFPDFKKPFILTTDASNYAIGAVLSQGPLGSDKPIAYFSKTLGDTQTRYSTIEKELLAIIEGVKHFRPYLYGNKFTIYTDHRPLAWLYSLKEPNSKLTRWRLRLEEYDFEIRYKKGPQNTNADALSRIRVNAIDDDIESMLVNIDADENTIQDVVMEIEDDVARFCNREPQPETAEMSDSDDGATAHSVSNREHEGIPILNEAIDTKPKQIIVYKWLMDKIQVKDKSNNKQRILEVHLPINKEDLVKNFFKEYVDFKHKYFIYFEDKDSFRPTFTHVVTQLYKKGTINLVECTERIINLTSSENEQVDLIRKYHEGKTCHRGINETYARLRRSYWWNNMKETITAIINGCEQCKKMKYERKPIKPPIQLTQTQDAPFQEIFIDLLFIEGKYYLTAVDAFSKLAQAIHIPNRSTPEVVRALIKYFSMYGLPRKISSDSGAEFNNELLKELLSFYKIDIHIGTPNNPTSMAIVERFHSTIIEIYRIAKYDRSDQDACSVMTYAIMAYNNAIHTATNFTPFEIVFGHTESGNVFDTNRDVNLLQILIQDHRKRLKVLYEFIKQKLETDKIQVREKKGGEEPPKINVGDKVFMKNTRIRKAKDLPRLNVQRLDPNPGIAPIRIGTATREIDHWSIVKTLDLELIENQVERNIEEYNRIKTLAFKETETRRELMGLTVQIQSILNLTKDRLSQIVPTYRSKRGLLNPLGSLIKVISGNLDNEDAIRYNQEIKKLQNKEHSVENKISLIKVAVEKLVNVSNDMNLNLNHINFNNHRLSNIINNQTIIFSSFRLMNSMFQIFNNFRTLYQVIYEIETAIAFSKLHTLHKFILNTTELFNILLEVEKHANLMYKVNENNLINLEQSITMKTYLDHKKLVFILDVPLVENNTYNYYKVMPIPIYNPSTNITHAIIPQYPFLIVKRMKYIPVAKPCEEIERERYLCSNEDITEFAQELCIEQLMLLKNNYSACQQREVHIERIRIQPITESLWMLFLKDNTIATERCHDEIRRHTLRGTYILTRNDECVIEIGGTTISPLINTTAAVVNLPLIQLPTLTMPDDLPRWTPINLRNVDLRDISAVVKQISDVDIDDSVEKLFSVTTDISVWTISIYVILISIVILFLSCYFKRNFQRTTVLPVENSSLGEGGVRAVSPEPICFVSNIQRST
ncbi:hypothetical protein ABMA27_010024 [Loxostege sticticalis]|uniref:RNA-directed DNA polymerase n=1 Tax=Loxostege sticticalis TaxID=481309 RepID=A0ABR3H7A2_LOXSC